jgi:hypothetical protein
MNNFMIPATHPTKAEHDADIIAREMMLNGKPAGTDKFNSVVQERKLARWEAFSLGDRILRRYLQLIIQAGN